MGQDTQADPPHDEGAQGAHDDEEQECQEEADGVGNDHEDDYLGGKKKKCTQKDHT
jgi:hypothetical protein